MKKVNILYDATIINNIFTNDSCRSGIFFVAYNVLLELLKRDEFNVVLYCDDVYKVSNCVKNLPELGRCKVANLSLWLDLTMEFIYRKKRNKQNHGNPIMRGVYSLSASIFKKLSKKFPKKENFENINVFFSPFAAVPEVLQGRDDIIKYTVLHDTIPIVLDEYRKDIENGWFGELVNSINGKDKYFANSEFTKQDFIKYVPNINGDNITVIPLATGMDYHKIDDINIINKVKQKYNIPLDKKYIFSLSNLDPRKNHIYAMKNFLRFIEKNKLEDFIFVVGGSNYSNFVEELDKHFNNLGALKDKILRIGYVEDEDMSALYSGSEMFIYPSLYEGFGMPILEAMQCGVPVICSNVTSMPEVIGDCGIQVDPKSDEQLINAMEKMYFDREFRLQCVNKGLERAKLFTWKKCVDVISKKILEDLQVYQYSEK